MKNARLVYAILIYFNPLVHVEFRAPCGSPTDDACPKQISDKPRVA